MATLIFTDKVLDEYNKVKKMMTPVDRDVRVKTMKDIIQESFFHGSSRFGDNFIA